MGHMVGTYYDIQMKGIDFLRNVYATSGLAIKPKTQVSKVEDLKEIIRAWGMNPEQLLTREDLAEGAITYVNWDDYENHPARRTQQFFEAAYPTRSSRTNAPVKCGPV